ncbi:hypothetical protein Tco_0875485 [Tanacetum coccineum]|uniref:Uncharacterized protein n=1 Tax=Tanacetum coccineum TaxID=301880 RepID=A0ABQ5BV87_9ASTR
MTTMTLVNSGKSRYRLKLLAYAPPKKAYRIYNQRTGKYSGKTVSIVPSMNLPRVTSVQPVRPRTSTNASMMNEVVLIPLVVPITSVNVPAAPAPENAIGSPSTTVISEGAPAVTESLLPHQIPLPDTSDSDDETLFDHVDSNSGLTHIMGSPETGSMKHLHPTVSMIDVDLPNNQVPPCSKVDFKHIRLKT